MLQHPIARIAVIVALVLGAAAGGAGAGHLLTNSDQRPLARCQAPQPRDGGGYGRRFLVNRYIRPDHGTVTDSRMPKPGDAGGAGLRNG
jgi:hypothetical protein